MGQGINLRNYNSFGIQATCKEIHFIKEERDLNSFYGLSENEYYILGGGSNILLQNNINKTVLRNEIKGIEIIHEDNEHVTLKVGGGENWHEFVLWTINQGYSGIENLSLIPGTVGAAPVQNIGAYGVEQDEVFIRLEGIEMKTGISKILNKKACEFHYRDSIFKNSLKALFFITRVHYKLNKKFEPRIEYGDIKKTLSENLISIPTAKDVSSTIISIRQNKLPDPAIIGNAGSFFKNPIVEHEKYQKLKLKYPEIPNYRIDDTFVKIPAAWMIESCGWKGKRIGDAGCHERQALVLVNHGNASGHEILQLADNIIESVNSRFGILLEKEVNIWT